MRDIANLILPDSPVEEADAVDEEGVVACLPTTLDPVHKAEILQIIDQICRLDGGELESRFERYAKLLELYHEQPNLLDSIIPAILQKLLSYISLPQNSYMANKLCSLSSTATKFLFNLMTVRGFKIVVRLLPHEVTFLEPLLSCLEQYGYAPVGSDLSERATLLYWLWIVCKNPFDLRRFDPINSPGSTMKRIFAVAMPYLEMRRSRAHYASALLISECLSRVDGRFLCGSIIEKALNTMKKGESTTLFGNLLLLLYILKHVDRQVLIPFIPSIVEPLSRYFPLNTKDSLIRKCLIKMVQRIALVLLRPKLAKWRYQRGKRRLEDNLTSGVPNKQTSIAHSFEEINLKEDDSDGEDEEGPEETIEWCLDCLLRGLCDSDTVVRWSAAKGIGRIAGRLHIDLASEVVQSVLDSCFHRSAGHASWHGGCMALAELSRRGLLLPNKLPQAFPIVRNALFYEEPIGRHAFGRNVRDAACYVFWAWARAYEAKDTKEYVDIVATSLVCSALFDREISIRRAASAAFQENVGRQSNFPDGISLLTIVDYFAVGNRLRCYNRLCTEIVAFPKYADAMVDHLLEYKVIHWDPDIRCESASAMEHLASRHSDYVKLRMEEKLLHATEDSNPVRRHGILYSLSHTVRGLRNAGMKWEEKVVAQLATVPISLRLDSKKSKAVGGELTRLGLAEYIKALAECDLPLTDDQIEDWLSIVNSIACDATESVREAGFFAARSFIPKYLKNTSDILTKTEDYYCKIILTSTRESDRIGGCSLAGCIVVKNIGDEERILDALQGVILKRSSLDEKWAFGRVAAVKTLCSRMTRIVISEEKNKRSFEAFFAAMDDYTQDNRGDIGRFVREEAMKSLAMILTVEGIPRRQEYVLRAVCKMIQQSSEKIGRTRECACECIQRLIECPLIEVPHREQLRKVYNDPSLFIHDRSLERLSSLFAHDAYYSSLVHGLCLSAGGVSDVTIHHATLAITDHLVQNQNNIPELNRFLDGLWSFLAQNSRIPRIVNAVLQVFPSVVSRMRHLEENPDENVALGKFVAYCLKVSSSTASPHRVRLCLCAVGPLLNCNPNTNTWKQASHVLLRALRSAYPVVRRNASEALYETLCMKDDVNDEVLVLLSETSWADTCDKNGLDETANEIERILVG